MSPRGTDTRDVDNSFARARMEDARAFRLQAAITADRIGAAAGRKAAASSAALAAIAAADAACAAALGLAWKGEHTQGHTLLRRVNGSAEAAAALQRLVGSKTSWQYLQQPVSEASLAKAFRQADKIIEFAEKLLRSR